MCLDFSLEQPSMCLVYYCEWKIYLPGVQNAERRNFILHFVSREDKSFAGNDNSNTPSNVSLSQSIYSLSGLAQTLKPSKLKSKHTRAS